MARKPRAIALGPWPYLVLLIFPAISLVLHFGGRMVLGWDSQPPLRPELLLAASLSAWRWGVDLGQPSVFIQLTQTPLALVYELLALPFGIVLAQKILLTVLFALPAFTMYYCTRRIFPGRPAIAFLAGWCYALSPLAFVRLYIPIVQVALAYAVLPLLVAVWLDVLRRGARPAILLRLAALQLAILPAAANLAYWLVPQLTAGAFVVLVAMMERKPSGWRAAQRIAIGAVVIALLNGFWLFPQALFGVVEGSTYESEAVNKDYTAGVRKDVAENSALAYTIRFSSRSQITASDKNGPYWTYASTLGQGFVAAPYYLWVIFAGIAVAALARNPRVVALGVILCGAIFVMKGDAPPLAAALDLLYRLPLAGTLFRDSYDKLLPAAAFASALLVPAGFEAMRRCIRAPQWAAAVVVLAVGLMAFPAWTGQMFMARPQGPTLASIPPSDAWAFARTLDAAQSRVLFAPASANPELFAMKWPYYGVNVYVNMTKGAVIASPEGRTNSPDVDAVTSDIYTALLDGDAAHFIALTKDAAVGYVFVAHDVDTIYYGGLTPAQVDTFLARLGNTRIEAQAGPYTLWRLSWVPPRTASLALRTIVSTSAPSLTQALALAPKCATPDAVLMWYTFVPGGGAACYISPSSLSDPARADEQSAPMQAQIEGRQLIVSAAAAERRRSKHVSRGAVPVGTSLVRLQYRTVGMRPAPIGLVACAPYRYESFARQGPATRVPMPAAPSAGGLFLPLPHMTTGWYDVFVTAHHAQPSVSLRVIDRSSKDAVVIGNALTQPESSLLMYAMPGRTYEFDTDAVAASEIASIDLVPETRSSVASLVAPPVDAPRCERSYIEAPTYVVLDQALVSTKAVVDGKLLVRIYGASPPLDVMMLPLAPGTSLIETQDGVLSDESNDQTLYAGTPMVVRGFRLRAAGQAVRFENVHATGQLTVRLRSHGLSMLLNSLATDQFAYAQLPPLSTGQYALTVDVAGSVAPYGAAVADGITSRVVAGVRDVSTPRITLLFQARPRTPYTLFLYPNTLGDPNGTLTVSGARIAPVEQSGTTAVTVPAVTPGLSTQPNAFSVERLPKPHWKALVLDTQFDRFWSTVVLRSRMPLVVFPQHVVADGYKNAWLLPDSEQGFALDFYLLTWLGYAGLALAAAVVGYLIVCASRS